MWTKIEIKKLINLYPDETNINIAKALNKTKAAIDNTGFRLGLTKSKNHLSKRATDAHIVKKANGGRDLSYDNLKKIATNYKTRIDFIRGDGSAYNAARKKGFLDKICDHMTIMKFSIPQLILREITDEILNMKSSYNNRIAIKPYEIDVYYEEYKLGFEFQGIAWHLNNKNDLIKSNIAKEKGITILYINEISRYYENDIKQQLINQLSVINSITNKRISEGDIKNVIVKNIYLELYNKNELIKIAKKYQSFKDFVINNKKIYRKLLQMKLVNEATSHMVDKNVTPNHTTKTIKSIIDKYDNLTDFRTNELQLYKHIKRVGDDDLISHFKRKPSFTLNEIKLKIDGYTIKRVFINENKKMYKYIRSNGLTYLLKHLKNTRGQKSIDIPIFM